MPELPEVETVRRQLAKSLEGRRILRTRFSRLALREPVPGHRLTRALKGAQIVQVRRRGKYLLWDLSHGYTMLAHLGMSGRFFVLGKRARPALHTHGIWRLDNETQIHYVDPRRFGLLKLYPTDTVMSGPELADMGLEPFDPAFTAEWLRTCLVTSGSPIKSWLMDQKRISGLGNIYVNEALFQAGIHPQRPAHQVRDHEAMRLHVAIRSILTAAIDQAGTTFLSYVAPDGNNGAFAESLYVFQREDERCRLCDTPIRRIVQSGRSSFFCPHCQL